MNGARHYRPLVQWGAARPPGALPLAGGPAWFAEVEEITRGAGRRVIAADALPSAPRTALTAPRAALAGLGLSRPLVMAVLNVTPDSFSDGGRHDTPGSALAAARAMLAAGADILDVGGESTRPGAGEVPAQDEIARTAPLIRALRAEGVTAPISIDTRKSSVAAAALEAGADIVNDVSAFGFDPAMADLVAARGVPAVLMHMQGSPETMQRDPRYEDVLLDVYDHLERRLAAAAAAGIPRTRLIADPGIGFGKTLLHNLELLGGLSVFHGLGCPILLGASRKSFIAGLTHAQDPAERLGGSLAAALTGAQAGVQILRVHDIPETVQALSVARAIVTGTGDE